MTEGRADSEDGASVLAEFARLPELANPAVAPDGDRVAFYYSGTGRNELHVLDLATGERERWSDGEVPENNFWPIAWTADGERILFHRDEDGSERNDVYAIAPDGSTDALVETDGMTNLRDVGADGETLLVGSNHDGETNVYRHDLPTGETTKLTDYDHPIWASHFAPDCDRVAYAARAPDDPAARDAYVVDVDGTDVRRLDVGGADAVTAPADWGPDGDRLLVSDDATDLARCGVYDFDADEVQWYGDLEYEESPEFFLPGGERFVATRKRDAVTTAVVYDVETGDGRELALRDGVVDFGMAGERVLDRDRVLVTYSTPTRRAQLLVYDLATDEYERRFECDYGGFSPGDFADAEYLTVESDGVPETPAAAVDHAPYEMLEIGALLYDSGERPSPLVVKPHGGPRTSDRKSFDYWTQFLVERGYAVLQVNYRGSTGRGREFADRLYGDWGGAEQGDVATAVEHVLDAYDCLDGDRVAVYGGSYGGYSAYWQLVQYPDLYDAGAAVVGFTDLVNFYENTIPQLKTGFLEKHLGTPGENPDLYRRRSPVEHVENLSAPLLMIHGVEDRRVPVSQARRFRDALIDHGREEGPDGDFEYHELDEQGHLTSSVDHRIRSLELLDEFLDRRL